MADHLCSAVQDKGRRKTWVTDFRIRSVNNWQSGIQYLHAELFGQILTDQGIEFQGQQFIDPTYSFLVGKFSAGISVSRNQMNGTFLGALVNSFTYQKPVWIIRG